MKEKIVIALGGNALGNSPEEQIEAVKQTAQSIVDLFESGKSVTICHGNGPQVGMIKTAMDVASSVKETSPKMPLTECGAMSQGYIGYHLQNSIQNELAKRGLTNPVVSLVTQVRVDENDSSFQNPTKPIGIFLTKEQADVMAKEGFTMKEDSGRGYRQVVASPKPLEVVEKDALNILVDSGAIVIVGGGGGIPVVERDGALFGVEAVIDKDLTSVKVAEAINADALLILTAVEKVAIRFGKPDVEWLSELSISDANRYIEDKEFAEGSMLPKIRAAIAFTESKAGRKTLITSLEKAQEGLEGKTGTVVVQ